MASAASIAPQKARKAELARMLSVSRQAVGDLVKRGILSEDKEGLIDVELARVALANRVRPSSKTAQALAQGAGTGLASPAAAPAGAGQQPSAGMTDEQAIGSYHVAKTLNETAQARMNQLRLQEMRGELIRVDAVTKSVSNAMAMARESLLQIPTRLASVISSESDPAVIHRLLDSEIRNALTDLAQGLNRTAEDLQTE